MKLNLRLGNKEAFIVGALSALGQVMVSEVYRTYVDIDPLAGLRSKMKVKKRKQLFNNIMKQTNLKEESA